MNTTVQKNSRNQWVAKTVLRLGENQELHILTGKHLTGQLVTRASAYTREGTSLTHTYCRRSGGGDFALHLHASNPARCNEEAVRAQHSRALEHVADVIALAREHYAQGVAA